MSAQSEIDSRNTLGIEWNTRSIIELQKAIHEEADRAISVESGIRNAIDALVDSGSAIDPKTTITATVSLIPPSEQFDDNVGNVYLLLGSQEGYVKNRMYRLEKDSSTGEFSYSDIRMGGLPVGNVTNIRFSFIDDTLSMKWNDPVDLEIQGVVVARWAGTRVMYKAYDSVQPSESAAYPQSPFDGTLLVNSTVRNQYANSTFTLNGLNPDKVYYVRFFPYTEESVYTMEVEHPRDGRFFTEIYSWNTLVEHLENYPVDSSLLPSPGAEISIGVLIDDFYTDTSTNTFRLALTRESVLESFSNPNASWNVTNTRWRVLGYNKSIPQYVKYRTLLSDGTYDYKYVSSVHDTASLTDFRLLDGSVESRWLLVGDLTQKSSISDGDAVYTRHYDISSGMQIFSRIDASMRTSPGKFTYGDYNTFSAPLKIWINDIEYDFCGYTMTMMPQDMLTGAHPSNDNVPTSTTVNTYQTMCFDASEMASAPALNTYSVPSQSSNDYGYYYVDTNGDMVAIDVLGAGLGGSYVGQYNGKDVYTLKCDDYAPCDGNGVAIPSLKMETAYFEEGHRYAHANGTEMVAGTDYVIATVIPTDEGYLELNNEVDRIKYGCNIYAQSNYRQCINNRYGANDDWYHPQNKFESVSKPSSFQMLNTNGLLLKLSKESVLLDKVVPSVNVTRVSANNQYYIKNVDGTYYTIDYFFPLTLLEVNLSPSLTIEGNAVYSDVYTSDNASRIKKFVNRDGSVSGTASTWWLRSPYTSSSRQEYCIKENGDQTVYNSNGSRGCSAACVIG